jgi:hypothetical protein
MAYSLIDSLDLLSSAVWTAAIIPGALYFALGSRSSPVTPPRSQRTSSSPTPVHVNDPVELDQLSDAAVSQLVLYCALRLSALYGCVYQWGD